MRKTPHEMRKTPHEKKNHHLGISVLVLLVSAITIGIIINFSPAQEPPKSPAELTLLPRGESEQVGERTYRIPIRTHHPFICVTKIKSECRWHNTCAYIAYTYYWIEDDKAEIYVSLGDENNIVSPDNYDDGHCLSRGDILPIDDVVSIKVVAFTSEYLYYRL